MSDAWDGLRLVCKGAVDAARSATFCAGFGLLGGGLVHVACTRFGLAELGLYMLTGGAFFVGAAIGRKVDTPRRRTEPRPTLRAQQCPTCGMSWVGPIVPRCLWCNSELPSAERSVIRPQTLEERVDAAVEATMKRRYPSEYPESGGQTAVMKRLCPSEHPGPSRYPDSASPSSVPSAGNQRAPCAR